MKILGILTIILLTLCGGACRKSEMAAANSDPVNSAKSVTATQKSEQAFTPKRLKAPEPCGWLEKSLFLNIKTEEYKESSHTPGEYHCDQAIVLVNGSQFNYSASGF